MSHNHRQVYSLLLYQTGLAKESEGKQNPSTIDAWECHTFNTKAFDYYPPLTRVRRHFETNYSASISLSDAARVAGLETKHFGKFFRQKVGIGFKRWATVIHIQIAIDVMRKEHRPLTDVAFAVGFQDFTTFERAFKKATGFTPSEYRKNIAADLLSKSA
jgi:AraC-like DNA-binding protein